MSDKSCCIVGTVATGSKCISVEAPIPQQLASIQNRIIELQTAIEELEERLRWLVCDTGRVNAALESSPYPPSSEMTCTLRRYNDDIEKGTERLRHLMTTLEV